MIALDNEESSKEEIDVEEEYCIRREALWGTAHEANPALTDNDFLAELQQAASIQRYDATETGDETDTDEAVDLLEDVLDVEHQRDGDVEEEPSHEIVNHLCGFGGAVEVDDARNTTQDNGTEYLFNWTGM